ncbi:MAG TPA: colanic acid biosynthesis glycosyltransferase WcaL [Crenotrichaceae bacterium]|nr:colanic acid biosynthesis glycosyltransferase WcaL [Crenotrichaceae bacterium]
MQAEIAYILKGYPRLSETFISNEIYLLESMGLKLRIYSIKQSDEQQSHGVINKIQAPVCYLPPLTSLSNTTLPHWLWLNYPAYADDHIRLLKQHPFAYLKTLGKTLWMTIRYRKTVWSGLRKVFIKEFIQAGSIAVKVMEIESVCHLHAHFCHGATTVAMFASSMTGKPYSFTAHAKDIYQHDLNPGNLLQKKIQQSAFVTTCTGANQIYLASLMGKDSIHKIYHGLDIHQFKPATHRVRNNHEPVRIISVGRYVEKKGFHYLLEACFQLKKLGYQFECRIIGEFDDQYLRLQQLREKLALEDCVALSGPITHEDLASIYQQSDIFALPCQVLGNGDRDGIPNVLMEAMASGLAVVSSNISGIPELIDSGKDGLLVSEKDSSALAEALQDLISNTGLRLELGKQARHRICREFDARNTNQLLLQLFEDCINQTNYSMTKPCLNSI